MPALTTDEARRRLASMVAADSEPTLDQTDLLDLLRGARRRDTNGVWADDAGWTPTYDLNAAAAEGWRRKAGKTAGAFDFSADGDSYSEGQMHDKCLEMARSYDAKVKGSIPFAASISHGYVVTNRDAEQW